MEVTIMILQYSSLGTKTRVNRQTAQLQVALEMKAAPLPQGGGGTPSAASVPSSIAIAPSSPSVIAEKQLHRPHQLKRQSQPSSTKSPRNQNLYYASPSQSLVQTSTNLPNSVAVNQPPQMLTSCTNSLPPRGKIMKRFSWPKQRKAEVQQVCRIDKQNTVE